MESKNDEFELNYPFYINPSYPMKGYYDKEFLNEVKRLYKYINNLETNNTLVYMVIGAAMEELFDMCSESITSSKLDHWMQLFPSWLYNCIANYKDLNIEIIIIAPNRSFNRKSEFFSVPTFIKETNDVFEWEKNNELPSWTSDNVKVNIFYTPMPHDDKNKERKYERFYKRKIPSFSVDYNIVKVTNNDVIFVKKFYDTLKTKIKKIINNGLFLCNSYAVARSSDMYNKFYMFSEIIDIIENMSKNKILLSEWKWTDKENLYYTTEFFNSKKISYVDDINIIKKNNGIYYIHTP